MKQTLPRSVTSLPYAPTTSITQIRIKITMSAKVVTANTTATAWMAAAIFTTILVAIVTANQICTGYGGLLDAFSSSCASVLSALGPNADA